MEKLIAKIEELKKALEGLKAVIESISAQDNEGHDLWEVMLDEIEALYEAPYSYGMPQAKARADYLFDQFKVEYKAVYGRPIPEPLRKAFIKLMTVLGVRHRRLGSLSNGETFGGITILQRCPKSHSAWVLKGGSTYLLNFDVILTSTEGI